MEAILFFSPCWTKRCGATTQGAVALVPWRTAFERTNRRSRSRLGRRSARLWGRTEGTEERRRQRSVA